MAIGDELLHLMIIFNLKYNAIGGEFFKMAQSVCLIDCIENRDENPNSYLSVLLIQNSRPLILPTSQLCIVWK